MPIDALPTPPSTQDPTNFDTRADAFLAALAVFQGQVNAALQLLNSPSPGRVVDVVAVSNVNLAGGGIAAGTVIDGVTLTAGMRVLCAAQTTAAEKGIYDVPASGAASRSIDANSSSLLFSGLTIVVMRGTTYAFSQWLHTTAPGFTLGSTSLTFTQKGGSGITASGGGGLNIAGTLAPADGSSWTSAGLSNCKTLLVNTNTPGGWSGIAKLEAATDAVSQAAVSGRVGNYNSIAFLGRVDATVANLAEWHYTTTVVGNITTNGTTTAYNTSSDGRLKDNIADAGDPGPILDALRVRQWDWKSNGVHEAFGFVAQEEFPVAPFAVVQGDDDPETIEKQWQRDDAKLVPLLVKEIQALRARVAALEAR